LRKARRVITAMGLVALALSLVGCAAPDRTVETTPPLTNWWTLPLEFLGAATIRGSLLVTEQYDSIVVYSIEGKAKLWEELIETDASQEFNHWVCNDEVIVTVVSTYEKVEMTGTDKKGKSFTYEKEIWKVSTFECRDLVSGRQMWRHETGMKWPIAWIIGDALYLMNFTQIEVRSLGDFSLIRTDAIPAEAGERSYPRYVQEGVLYFLSMDITGPYPYEIVSFYFDWWAYDLKERNFYRLTMPGRRQESSHSHMGYLDSCCLFKPRGDKAITFGPKELSLFEMLPLGSRAPSGAELRVNRDDVYPHYREAETLPLRSQQPLGKVFGVELPGGPVYAELWDTELYCVAEVYAHPSLLQVYSLRGKLLRQWSACNFWPIAREKFLVSDGMSLSLLDAKSGNHRAFMVALPEEDEKFRAFYNSEYFCLEREDSLEIYKAREGLIDFTISGGYYSGSRQVIVDGDFLVAW